MLDSTTVVTGLDIRACYPTYGAQATGLNYLSHYFAEAVDNEVAAAMTERVEAAGGEVDLFTPDGFTAAQMVVQAVREGGDDVDAMIDALEGWTFDGVKGELTVRRRGPRPAAADVPGPAGRSRTASSCRCLVDTLDPELTAPPVA